MRVLCLGTSYTGRYATVNFCNEHSFCFLSRTPGLERSLTYFDDTDDTETDCILNTTPPPKTQKSPEPAYHEIVAALLEKKNTLPYIYISSTAVFPDQSEERLTVFDEQSLPAPDSARGERRLEMERQILSFYPRAKTLRSAGIYGPGRSLPEQFKAGNYARAQIGNRLVSRIHVHDLLRLAFAMAQNPHSPPLVHAVDEKTASYSEVFSFLEAEFGLPIPGNWFQAEPRGRSIKSLYARDLLEGKYSFPTYQEGFRDVFYR